MDSWLLTVLIFLPLVGIPAIVLTDERQAGRIRLFAMLASLLALAVAIVAVIGFFGQTYDDGQAVWASGGLALEQQIYWIKPGGAAGPLEISYHVGLDGVSIWLVALTALISPLAIWGSFSGIRDRLKEYYCLMLLLEAAMLGVFCARDLLLFYIFFELTLVPLFFIIGIWGGPERRYAANKFFIYTMAGSVLTFGGILYLAWRTWEVTGVFSFELHRLYQVSAHLTMTEQRWLFGAMLAGFAIKVPLFPLHTWLPLAHTEAPTAGSVILAGILLKLGTYGFMRFALPLLPDATIQYAPTMAIIAIAGIIYGALVAWAQQDFKKLIAYSSVSHLGFCMLGMFSLKMAGMTGSLMYMVNHGLSTGALFLVVGMIYERYHTRQINDLGGLARRMPRLAFFMIFFTLTSIALPGLNGFVSEFLVLLGTFTSAATQDGFPAGPLGIGYAAAAALGVILGAIYMLWWCRRLLFGPVVEPEGTPDTSGGLPTDLGRRETSMLSVLAVACLLIGVYPKPLLMSMQPALHQAVLGRIYPATALLADRAAGEDRIEAAPAPVGRNAVAAPSAAAVEKSVASATAGGVQPGEMVQRGRAARPAERLSVHEPAANALARNQTVR